MNARPVLIMAGGTGGHIFPGIAVAEALRSRGVPVAWLGARGGMETELVPKLGIDLHVIAVRGLRGKGWRARVLAPWMLLRAMIQAARVVRRLRPRCALSLGGYVAGPGGLVAWIMRCPLVVHEQNSIPGVTNRWLARFARCVLVGFDGAFPASRHARWVGNPVRADIAAVALPAQRWAERGGSLRVLVLGGSLGARALNMQLPAALAQLDADARPQIWHQCGQKWVEQTRAAYAQAGVEAKVEPFLTDMASAYAWADLAVCRAGALTVAELCAVGLGAVLVPFPFAVDDHQTHNAQALVDAGAAVLMQERTLTSADLAGALRDLLADRAHLCAMATAARALAKPDGAAAIAACCLEVAP